LIADWMMPVPSSPDTCVNPAGVSVPKMSGMLPVRSKNPVSASATFC
jgi:hypothetical protein